MAADDAWTPRALTTEDRMEWWPTWSADGASLAFSTDAGIRLFELGVNRDTPLLGAEKMERPAWSPDGQLLAALARDPRRIMLFEFANGRWIELAETPGAVGQRWSPDGRSVWYLSGSDVYQIDVGDRRVEHVLSINDSAVGIGGVGPLWVGQTPDGSFLYLHDQSVRHIYALDWE